MKIYKEGANTMQNEINGIQEPLNEEISFKDMLTEENTRDVNIEEQVPVEATDNEQDGEAASTTIIENEFTKAVEKANQYTQSPGVNNKDRLPAGRFFTLEDKPPFDDVLLPPGYAITPKGVFEKIEDDISVRAICLTQVPFFISARDEAGRVQIIYRVDHEWFRTWMKPSSLRINTLTDLLIFPDYGVESRQLVEYATECASLAPFRKSNIEIMQVVKEISTIYLTRDIYPVYAPVPDVKKLCEEYEVKYDDVRKWLVQRGIIDDYTRVQRDNKKGNPTRYLIFQRAIPAAG